MNDEAHSEEIDPVDLAIALGPLSKEEVERRTKVALYSALSIWWGDEMRNFETLTNAHPETRQIQASLIRSIQKVGYSLGAEIGIIFEEGVNDE